MLGIRRLSCSVAEKMDKPSYVRRTGHRSDEREGYTFTIDCGRLPGTNARVHVVTHPSMWQCLDQRFWGGYFGSRREDTWWVGLISVHRSLCNRAVAFSPGTYVAGKGKSAGGSWVAVRFACNVRCHCISCQSVYPLCLNACGLTVVHQKQKPGPLRQLLPYNLNLLPRTSSFW